MSGLIAYEWSESILEETSTRLNMPRNGCASSKDRHVSGSISIPGPGELRRSGQCWNRWLDCPTVQRGIPVTVKQGFLGKCLLQSGLPGCRSTPTSSSLVRLIWFFGVINLRRIPLLRPGSHVCPEQDGMIRSSKVTCQRCQLCIRSSPAAVVASGFVVEAAF